MSERRTLAGARTRGLCWNDVIHAAAPCSRTLMENRPQESAKASNHARRNLAAATRTGGFREVRNNLQMITPDLVLWQGTRRAKCARAPWPNPCG